MVIAWGRLVVDELRLEGGEVGEVRLEGGTGLALGVESGVELCLSLRLGKPNDLNRALIRSGICGGRLGGWGWIKGKKEKRLGVGGEGVQG